MRQWLLLVLVIAGCSLPAVAQIEWTPFEGNPVITAGFDIEAETVYRPSVLKWKGIYHLWYGKLWQQTRWVAYTTSVDGIAWSNTPPDFDNAVLGRSATDGDFDELEASHASVILDGDTLKMWYGGVGSEASGIGMAWSTNGSVWVKVAGSAAGGSVLDPGLDGSGALYITHPSVVKINDVYHMWYVRLKIAGSSVLGYEARLGYGRSLDGLSWQVVPGNGANGAVVDLGSAGSFDGYAVQWPAVLYNENDGYFELWYQGVGPSPDRFGPLLVRVGCARSDDGVSWHKMADPQAQAGECFRSLAQPSVLLEDGLYKMWYALSATGENDEVVMYATSSKAPTAIERTELPTLVGGLEIYPNPTVAHANVRFVLERQSELALEVRDLLGRLILRDNLGTRAAGDQLATWNRLDARGAPVPAGAYVVSIVNSLTRERAAAGIVHVLRQ